MNLETLQGAEPTRASEEARRAVWEVEWARPEASRRGQRLSVGEKQILKDLGARLLLDRCEGSGEQPGEEGSALAGEQAQRPGEYFSPEAKGGGPTNTCFGMSLGKVLKRHSAMLKNAA